jgi:serine/threonine-protein kinase RsbW
MSQRFQITRAAELESLTAFREFITLRCTEQGVPSDQILDLKLAVDEACTNIIEHGYRGMDPGSIILSFRIAAGEIQVGITDFGHVFEPVETPKPDAQAALDEGKLGGFGWYLIYQTMDNVAYQATEEGNTLTFTKHLP